jgi:hypothetical membrane protein
MKMNKNILMIAGIAAGVLYLITDLVGGLITPDYSYIRNAVSELIQSGAKHRLALSPFMFLHATMIAIFGIGLMRQFPFQANKLVFIAGVLLLIVGICHALSSSVFPMDPVGAPATFAGTMHLVLVGITVLAIFVMMPLAAIGLKDTVGWSFFQAFTFICLSFITIAGFASPIIISKEIPLMGLTERITGYVFYVWLAVMGVLIT